MSDDLRRRELAAIHAGRRALHLDDDAYRALIEGVSGKRSAGDLDARERWRVLDTMRSLGYQQAPGRAQTTASDKPQIAKIKALWLRAGRSGAVRNASREALAAFVKRVAHVDSMNWLTVELANKVIEALKSMISRHEQKKAS